MSLRARLTLLHTTLLGGILLFFGVIVYLFVSYLLIQQIDENLIRTFDNLLKKTEMIDGNLDINQPASRDLMSNVFAQAWDRRGQLQYSSVPNLNTPFDPCGLQATQPVFRNLYFRVAKEQARLFLPGFSVYYTWVTKTDAHNLLHFLSLRMAPDAQYEIRAYAQAIYDHFFVKALPWTAEAFQKYIVTKF